MSTFFNFCDHFLLSFVKHFSIIVFFFNLPNMYFFD